MLLRMPMLTLLCCCCRFLEVGFEGEKGSGEGVVRDWLTELSKQLFDPALGLFGQLPSDSGIIHPSVSKSMTKEQVDLMELAGKVTGQASHSHEFGSDSTMQSLKIS